MNNLAYKPVTYNGYKIVFVSEYGNVFARAPRLTRQFIGSGKTKAAAMAEAKATINRVARAKTRAKATEKIVVEKLPFTEFNTHVIRYVPTPGRIKNVSIKGMSRFDSREDARAAIKSAGGVNALKRRYRQK